MNRSRNTRLTRLALSLVVLGLVATACGSSSTGVTEYKDPEDRALFVIPDDWNLYQADELVDVSVVPFSTQFTDGLPVIQQVAFDGAAGRDINNLSVSAAAATYPVGAFTVRSIGAANRDFVSRSVLEEMVVPQGLFEQGSELLAEDFDFGRNYEGIRRFIPFQDSTTEDQGVVYFVTVTNPDETAIYTIAAGCSTACWETFQDDIVGVVDSWIVNTRQ